MCSMSGINSVSGMSRRKLPVLGAVLCNAEWLKNIYIFGLNYGLLACVHTESLERLVTFCSQPSLPLPDMLVCQCL